jgi:hypothetical protein
VFAVVSDSAINGNLSVGSISSGTIRLFGGNSNIDIDSNVLHNGMRGIWVDDPFLIGPNTDVTAHQNDIMGNSVAGLEASAGGHSGTLHAECNWWGSATGPMNPNNPGGIGDKVIDPDGVVDFTPWLTAPPPVGVCIGGASTPGK